MMTIFSYRRSSTELRFALCLICTSLLIPSAEAFGSLRAPCDDPICENALATADSLYIQGDFGDAITLLEYCLEQESFRTADEVPALVLIAKAHQREDRQMQARAVIVRILELNPRYRMDPVQETPDFRFLFEQIRQEMGLEDVAALDEETQDQEEEVSPGAELRPERPAWRRWLVAGGGAALAGTVAAVLLSGGNGGGPSAADRWPAPPGRPND